MAPRRDRLRRRDELPLGARAMKYWTVVSSRREGSILVRASRRTQRRIDAARAAMERRGPLDAVDRSSTSGAGGTSSD
jgi:hypothetical protein